MFYLSNLFSFILLSLFLGAQTAAAQELPKNDDQFALQSFSPQDEELDEQVQLMVDDFVSICSEIYMDEMQQRDWVFDADEALTELGYLKFGEIYEKRNDVFESKDYETSAYFSRTRHELPARFQISNSNQLVNHVDRPSGWSCAFKLTWQDKGVVDYGGFWLSDFYNAAGMQEANVKIRSRLLELDAPFYPNKLPQIFRLEVPICIEKCGPQKEIVYSMSLDQQSFNEWTAVQNLSSQGLSAMGPLVLRSDGVVVNSDGKQIARLSGTGAMIDDHGKKIGTLDELGNIIDETGRVVGHYNSGD